MKLKQVIILLMLGGSFLTEWVRYSKLGVLQHPAVVVGMRPTCKREFDFILEVNSQLAFISMLQTTTLPDHPNLFLLASHLNSHPPTSIITPEYVRHLSSLYSTWFLPQSAHRNKNFRLFLITILNSFVGEPISQLHEEGMSYVRMLLGVLRIGIGRQEQTLKMINGLWSFQEWTNGANGGLKKLCLQWLKMQSRRQSLVHKNGIQNENFVVFKSWFCQIMSILTLQRDINDQIVNFLVEQCKTMLKVCDLKSKKSSKALLIDLKIEVFRLSNHPQSLATAFALVDTINQQMQMVLIKSSDLLVNEQIYSSLFFLQKTDKLHYFPSFHKFMRNNSVISVLEQNRTLSKQMCSQIPQLNNLPQIQQSIQTKNMQLMALFNTKPITLATTVLAYYLNKSGIFITQKKSGKPQRLITKEVRLQMPDPLQFMLIKQHFWEERSGLEIIGLSMWIILEAYCQETHLKVKEGQKNINQYLKKLKITLSIFLLGLKYPIKLLQYLPFENDISADFMMIPILPKLLLDTDYFFSSFSREKMTFSPRKQFVGQGDIFPWSNSLTNQKNIHLILHNYKGYQFYGKVLQNISQNNKQVYGQSIFTILTTALQRMGISPTTPQPELKKHLSQLNPDSKQQITLLLQKLSPLKEKLHNECTKWRTILNYE